MKAGFFRTTSRAGEICLVVFTVIGTVLISACASISSDTREPTVLERRSASLLHIQSFYLSARLSVKANGQAWNGFLKWSQQPASYVIHFNSLLGQGALKLEGNKDSVQLSLADGSKHTADDAESLLYQQTSLELPINSLRYWILGVPQPSDEFVDDMVLDENGLIQTLDQSGWTVHYKRYQSVQMQGSQTVQLPRKIILIHDGVTVRIVVDRWELE